MFKHQREGGQLQLGLHAGVLLQQHCHHHSRYVHAETANKTSPESQFYLPCIPYTTNSPSCLVQSLQIYEVSKWSHQLLEAL